MLLGTNLSQRLIYSTKELWNFHGKKKESNFRIRSPFCFSKTSNRRGLIVVPSIYWETSEKIWGPGQGNIFFEIYQSAMESEHLEEIFFYKVESSSGNWHLSLIKIIKEYDIGFVLIDVEQNPTGKGNWDLDIKIDYIRKFWAGPVILFSIDMAFASHLNRAAKIVKNDSKSILIAIDRSIKKFFFARGLGPLLVPISQKTFDYIDSQFKEPIEKKYEITFIGTVYPQREKVLKMITDLGIPLTINPHHDKVNRPTYIDYIKTIMESSYTLNLSKAGRDPVSQVKSRILEATAFGTPVLTDSRNNVLGNLPLEKGIHRFNSLSELEKIIEKKDTINEDSWAYIVRQIKKEARIHATKNFWATIASKLFDSK